ncbi:1,4-dihydroxy-2-naphthoate octaprenyltransferase [Verrucomicrobiales bacterium]|jgi:1,4-dihydroxy-2-naphthoate polyprenyltransferase|nr:1,4-dihydroxy-2-naphthoate octaprenyltransferase [Verrucomicrobiales bacterium]MDA7644382.1 1,4-dihydroxy-2-naphthoate octaprenyltransferase [Verrucomicrobiales bacterium]MDB4772588.1 1,4-dihydroxy-2-naphthoate octaprenyltransferase [Verrucomicrobiales bacterium]MDC0503721.1 1,4-dihydroxy-2-naphthoate octaprenyltransferase [Verrucomicrobiales bacterium]
MTKTSLKAWVLAARPKTLPAAVAPVTVGTVLGAQLVGAWRVDLAFFALLSCLALQIATNLFNDAIDYEKGADTENRLGPRRVTASGDLSSRQVMWAALVVLGLSGLCALPLWQARGWLILAIGIPSLYLCYGYTGGPMPLAYRGLGDLFVLVFFGWVAVIGSCFLQTGRFDLEAVLLGTQIGLLSVALIAINNLRDHEEDAGTGKRTLAVRLGPFWARWEVALTLVAPCLLGLAWFNFGRPSVALWPLATLPLGAFIAARVWATPPSPSYNRFLALSALHLVISAGLLTLALLQR